MRPGKTTHIFQVANNSVKFSGNFDSGNLRNVLQNSPEQYELQTAFDSYTVPCTTKAFFHFYVEGFPLSTKLILVFRQLSLFQCLKEDTKRYRAFHSFDGQNYERLSDHEVQTYDSYDGPVLRIIKIIQHSRVFFSFSLPYSYERYLNMVRDLPTSDSQMYIQKEVICYSINLNLVYMISVTSHNRICEQEQKICENTNGIILPEKHLHQSKKYFDKPVILLSSRVHPGQTSSSWAMQGILKFITSGHEQAKLLRKHFQIILIPMLNPDGVEEGLYRLDTRGHNLNRYYLISDNRQPSIYCMKHLIRHYQQTKRLLYYFDLHGHPNQKGSFLYGNAIDELPFQVETELFARLLSDLCPSFEQKFCIFDREQMYSKDKNDMYTKEGCARVYTFRMSSIIHSYTIQHGFHGLSDPCSSFIYQKETYYQEGRSLMTAVLISSGLLKPKPTNLSDLRRQLASEICSRQERFRREDKHLQLKRSNVNQIIEQEYWRPIYDQYFNDRPIKRSMPRSRHRLRLQKRESLNLNMPNYLSEQIAAEQQEQRCSIDHTIEENRVHVQKTNIGFKMHRTNNSLKSTQISSKSEMEERVVTVKLVKLPFHSSKPREEVASSYFRDKMKGMRRPIALRSIEHSLKKEQDHMFSDINIRDMRLGEYMQQTQPVHSIPKRNKIHSLFIDTYS